ncbi:sporulation YhaL family protein [Pontibacillus litoralis]|uniref:SigE-dependent sporulation protein n=1 Tax=Pontibacillus litoralis JSM 072002 TaxID=1385512 RepID=A0A0A5HNR1_9BACI|nr:sporulation YhaL family protein [Pontibacillus litoralis]KGX85277.1 hypothetical protein N784_09560 [Pontibacillus litoralis JSM 072002]
MVIAGMPWWVLLIIAIIIYSGYMAFRSIKEEKQMERNFIEQEGRKYMKRIEEARKEKEQDRHIKSQSS